MRKILIVLFGLISFSCFAQQGWFYLNPTPDANNRFAIQMFNKTSGVCRGYNNIYKTRDGGKTWREINFNVSDYPLGSFSMFDSSNGYAVLAARKLFKTTDGCESWKLVTQLPYNYNGISFASKTLGFNVIYDSTNKGKIFRTSNGGLSWNEVYSSDSSQFRGFNFLNQSTGYIVGYKHVNSYPVNYYSKILKTTNAGLSWDSIPSINFRDNLYGAYFLNENTGFLFLSSLLLRTTNGGITWKDSVFRNTNGIRFFDENTGYGLFDYNTLGKTTNAGKNWIFTTINNSTINSKTVPTSVYFFDQSTGISVGAMGLNLKTTNGGTNWINYNTSQFSDEIDDIIFKNDNTGFAMGWSRNIFKTTDAGLNWIKNPLGLTSTFFGAMSYAGNNTWYLTDYFNQILHKTTNDGVNWISSNPGISGVTDLQFLNENTGFGVCKYYRFVKTTNGGLNWFKNDSIGSQNWTVSFIDENTGYIGGGSRLRKTTNGGITFDTIPRSSVYSAWDVEFISRDTIIASGSTFSYTGYYENTGTIWKSTDAGATWVPKYYAVSNYLSGPLKFTNSKTGYVYDGSQYMYKTTTGGDNWFQIIVPEGYLYSLHFLNSETGYIAGDNGIIAKTTNGGISSFTPVNETAVTNFMLHQNYPNPFNPTTKIKFDLPKSEKIKIIIFDILGRQMETLLDENFPAGEHEVNWNASNYSAGVYFYMLLTENTKETKKMVLIK